MIERKKEKIKQKQNTKQNKTTINNNVVFLKDHTGRKQVNPYIQYT